MEVARPLAQRSLEALLRQAIDARAEGLVVLRDREGVRHGLWVEGGYVLGLHVAGRFDPLLELLRRAGALTERSHRRCLEALRSTGQSAGQVACSIAGLPGGCVRDALRAQAIARFVALRDLATREGHDAWLERARVLPGERSVRMPLGSLLRAAERARPEAASPEAARRALRALAKQLHPDLHPHLDPAARSLLTHALARATAAYHGLGVDTVPPR